MQMWHSVAAVAHLHMRCAAAIGQFRVLSMVVVYLRPSLLLAHSLQMLLFLEMGAQQSNLRICPFLLSYGLSKQGISTACFRILLCLGFAVGWSPGLDHHVSVMSSDHHRVHHDADQICVVAHHLRRLVRQLELLLQDPG